MKWILLLIFFSLFGCQKTENLSKEVSRLKATETLHIDKISIHSKQDLILKKGKDSTVFSFTDPIEYTTEDLIKVDMEMDQITSQYEALLKLKKFTYAAVMDSLEQWGKQQNFKMIVKFKAYPKDSVLSVLLTSGENQPITFGNSCCPDIILLTQ